MNRISLWILTLSLFYVPLAHAVSTDGRASVSLQKRSSEHQQIAQKKCFNFFPAAITPIYYVKGIGTNGGTVITTDETVWQVDPSFAYIAFNWPVNATIVITPDNWFFSNDYLLTNTATQESVRATLSQGPLLQYAITITQINYYTNILSLSNGMTWQVYDDSSLGSWVLGQCVLLGINESWLGGKNILININENEYLTANILN